MYNFEEFKNKAFLDEKTKQEYDNLEQEFYLIKEVLEDKK